MVFTPDEKLRQKMSKDGSVLKYMHDVAGIGKGLLAGGGMLVFVGVLLTAALVSVLGVTGALFAGALAAVPGALLIAGGVYLRKRRLAGWMKAYVKHTGLSEADILKADEEFKEPGTLLLSLEKTKDSNSLKRMGFVTTHYVKMPGVIPAMARLEDVAACFYTKRFRCQDGGYDKALVAYSRDKKMAVTKIGVSEKVGVEIVDAVAKRNPAVIKDHHFMYEGREYDAAQGMDDVIELYERMTGVGRS